MGINGEQAALYLIEDIVIAMLMFQVRTESGGLGKHPYDGFHLTSTYADFMNRATTGVSTGTSRTLV